MTKLFVDSDIILDLLAKREPHYTYSSRLFTLIDKKEIIAFTSPLIIANLHYLFKKMTSNASALKSLRKLKTFVNILPIDHKVIDQSLNPDFNDFEDAIQYFTAVNNGLTFLLRRNKRDYKQSKISVLTAEEFLKTLQAR